MWHVEILTLFPQAYPGILGLSVLGRALKENIWSINATNIRDFGLGKHREVDDTVYGGGSGMVMRADVLAAAINATFNNSNPIIYLTPRGETFSQKMAKELATKCRGINIICGRYEGVDERLFSEYNIRTVSLGNYIVSSGDVVALPMIDACVRNLPKVLADDAILDESFSINDFLLEYPHYTKPQNWQGHQVPEVLLSGNHSAINAWRRKMAEEITKNARPDLWDQYIKEKEK